DDDAALVVFGLVLGHVCGGQPADVEGGDQVEIDNRLEGFEVVGARLGQRPLGDTAAGGGDHDMQAAQLVDRGLQRLLGAGVVRDVYRVERATDALGNRLTVGTLAVEDRDISTTLGEQFGRGPTHPRRAADDDGLLPIDLHPDVSFLGCQI